MRWGMIMLGLSILLFGAAIAFLDPYYRLVSIGILVSLHGLITILLGLASSSWWWLCPLYFGIIGGLIGYVGTKDEEGDMDIGLLIAGIVWEIIIVIIALTGILRYW